MSSWQLPSHSVGNRRKEEEEREKGERGNGLGQRYCRSSMKRGGGESLDCGPTYTSSLSRIQRSEREKKKKKKGGGMSRSRGEKKAVLFLFLSSRER